MLSTVQRRRGWNTENKVAILDVAFRKGGSVAASADRFGVSRALIYICRSRVREGLMPGVAMTDVGVSAVPRVATVAVLKQLVVADVAELPAKPVELSAAAAELAAAQNGLVITQLTNESPKVQIAEFRREKLGASSERIDRALEQLELALQDATAAKAEAIAPQPHPSESVADAPPVEAAGPEKKTRRQLLPEFPLRDAVHRPHNVCKRCGGTDLRDVSESVTEVLRYVPGHFAVDRRVRPACSCRKCEAMMQAPMAEPSGARQVRVLDRLPSPRQFAPPSGASHFPIAR